MIYKYQTKFELYIVFIYTIEWYSNHCEVRIRFNMTFNMTFDIVYNSFQSLKRQNDK